METFVTVIAILAMIALGVLLIHLVNSRHSEGIAAYHYGRSGTPVAGPAPRKARGRAGPTGGPTLPTGDAGGSAPDDAAQADGTSRGATGVGQRT